MQNIPLFTIAIIGCCGVIIACGGTKSNDIGVKDTGEDTNDTASDSLFVATATDSVTETGMDTLVGTANHSDSVVSTDTSVETGADTATESFSDTATGSDADTDTGSSDDTSSQCGDTKVEFNSPPPTVLLLIDRSGSMDESFDGGSTRWEATRDALVDPTTGFLSKLESHVRFGLTLYSGVEPTSGAGECPNLDTVVPALNNYAAIAAFYQASEPQQNTPTPDAVWAATQMLRNDGSDSQKIIVLVTDGLPDTCADPSAIDLDATSEASVNAVAAAFNEGIITYVMGVGLSDTTGHFQQLANAGMGVTDGTGADAIYYEINDQDELTAAFEEILHGVDNCTFSVQGDTHPLAEGTCVVYVGGQTVPFNDPDGWKLNASNRLELSGSACDTVANLNTTMTVTCPCDVLGPK